MTQAETPTISVLMSVHNGARWLGEAIDSILGQTFADFEFIIVDDGSTDECPAILRDYAARDGRIVLVTNEKNIGLMRSLNRGLDRARGKYIARMDSDDISLPYRFERQVAWLEQHPSVALVCGLIRQIDPDGRHIGFWADDLAVSDAEAIRRMLPARNCIAHPTIMARADVLRRFRYNERVGVSEDHELWLRIAAAGLVIDKIPEVLLHYRIHTSSMTTKLIKGKAERIDLKLKFEFVRAAILQGRFGPFERRVAWEMLHTLHIRFHQRVKPYRLLRKALPYLRENLSARSMTPVKTFGVARPGDRPELLLVMPSLGWGGAERVSLGIIQALHDDFDLHVVATRGGAASWRDQYAPYCRTVSAPPEGLALRSRRALNAFFARAVDVGRLDGVLINNSVLGYYWLCDLAGHGVRLPAADIQHTVGAETHRPEMLWAALHLDRRVCISQALVNHMRELYTAHGMPGYADRLRLVRNGIDLDQFQPDSARALPLPAGIELGPGEKAVVWAGRFSAEKDPLLMLEVAAAFKRQGGGGLKFIMAGDGPLLGMARRAAAQMGVADIASFPGFLNDAAMRALIGRAWLLAITSVYEGVPLVAQEALAMGVPVISTAVGALGELVQDGRTGILLPARLGFPAAAAARMLRLIERPDEYDEMSAAARPSLEGKYDLHTMSDGYRAVCRELVAGRAR